MRRTKNGPKGKFQERRRAQRLDIPLRVDYTFLPKKNAMEETFSRDVSGGGVRLKLAHSLKKGTRLKTFIYFPYDKKPIATFSKVVWCRKGAADKGHPIFEVGVQHVKIAPKDRGRFVFLFCEMMINYFIFGQHQSGR